MQSLMDRLHRSVAIGQVGDRSPFPARDGVVACGDNVPELSNFPNEFMNISRILMSREIP